MSLLVVMIVLAGACGSRVSETQRTQALGPMASATGRPAAVAAGGDQPADLNPSAEPGSSSPTSLDTAAPTGPTATTPAGGNGGATEVGVTGNTITLGNISTLSGPIPGLFQGAVIGAQAFVAHVNHEGGVFGRQLKLDVRDDQFDSGQNRTQAQDLSRKALAMLGSFSVFDDASAPLLTKANVPDIGYGLTDARRSIPQNFSPQPGRTGTFRTGGFEYYGKKFPSAIKAVGSLYGDVPASKASEADAKAAAESVGWRWVYERGYQPTETDFTADVIRMRQQGVKGVYLVAADVKTMARLLKAMEQQQYKPEFVALGASAYDATFPMLAGSAAEGVWIDQQLALYQGGDAGAVPEVALMNQWIQKVKPGFKPDLYSAYSWASGRLLLQALQAAGPRLTRPGLLAALRHIDEFDANGLVAPAGPASKRPPSCNLFMQVRGGRFVRVDPAGKGFVCSGRLFSR